MSVPERSPDVAWLEEIPIDDQSLGRYRPLRVLEEKQDFIVFEAEDTEGAGQRVEVRVYRWGRQGEYSPHWQQWRNDARKMKLFGNCAVTAMSTPFAGITVSRCISPKPDIRKVLRSAVRDPLAIFFAEIIAVMIVFAAFHILVLEPGAHSAHDGATREACRGNLRHIESALTMYYSDHGRYPETLAELIPTYLPKPLTCPAGGMYTGSSMDSGGGGLTDPAALRCTRCGPAH
jgi:hypothetical protein